MIIQHNFLLIGSTGRNSGKTEFACRVIKAVSARNHLVYGVKVTAIDCTQGGCPRGGEGCGVCSSLKEKFEITGETNADSPKDTSRMLQAGAQKVLWLKVDKRHMVEGVEALLSRIPSEAMVVCESNTLRNYLEPGLFLIIRNNDNSAVKKSAAQVLGLADRVIGFQDMGWDYDPMQISIQNKKWAAKEKATAVILAGGKSSRMGGNDKSMLSLHGETLIATIVKQLEPVFDEILIGANDTEKYRFLNKRVVPDIEKEKGPLMGILSCLRASANEANFITACDIPVMHIPMIRKMIGMAGEADIVMPVTSNGRFEPLFSVYNKRIADVAEMVLQNNGRKIVDLFGFVKTKHPEMDGTGWYRNLNRKEDYLEFLKTWNIPNDTVMQ